MPWPSTRNCLVITSLLLVVATLSRLTAIGSASLWLLVCLHACTERNVNAGWCVEAEALGHLDKVKFVDVEDGTQSV